MLVAIYNRTFDEENLPTFQRLVEALERHRIQIVVFRDFYERMNAKVAFAETPRLFTSKLDLPPHTDMLFSLGGDGTLLDTIIFVGNSNIPLIGINLEFGSQVTRDGVVFRYGDVTDTGLPTGHLDAITCMSVIEHGVPLEGFIAESARLLRDFFAERRDAARARRAERRGIIPTGEATELDPT